MNKNKERPGVMMYFHLLEPMRCLPKEQFADMIWALMDYAQHGVLPVFSDPLMTMSWGYLQHAADVDLERYEERCAQAKAASAKRWGKDASASERMRTVPNTTTETDTTADADAVTNASASADTQSYPTAAADTEAAAEAQTETGQELPGVPPRAPAEPLETPWRMANSPSWAKMQEASKLRREGEAFEAWREAQIAEITRQNEALRAEARAKKKRQGA